MDSSIDFIKLTCDLFLCLILIGIGFLAANAFRSATKAKIDVANEQTASIENADLASLEAATHTGIEVCSLIKKYQDMYSVRVNLGTGQNDRRAFVYDDTHPFKQVSVNDVAYIDPEITFSCELYRNGFDNVEQIRFTQTGVYNTGELDHGPKSATVTKQAVLDWISGIFKENGYTSTNVELFNTVERVLVEKAPARQGTDNALLTTKLQDALASDSNNLDDLVDEAIASIQDLKNNQGVSVYTEYLNGTSRIVVPFKPETIIVNGYISMIWNGGTVVYHHDGVGVTDQNYYTVEVSGNSAIITNNTHQGVTITAYGYQ